MVERGDMLSIDDVLEILAIDLIGIIPEDEAILVSSNRGTPVAMNSTNSASASQAFRNIALRLKGEQVPFIDLTVKLSLVDRIRNWVAAAGRPN